MRGLDVVRLGLRAVALSAVFTVLGFAPFAARAAATTYTVDCSQVGVQATTWTMIALDDLTIPVPAPYALQGQCALADFNGDGKLDLLNQTATGDVTIFYQKSDGKYRQIDQRIAKDAYGLNWSAQNATLLLEDVNGDGRTDIRLQSKDVGGFNAVLLADSTGKIYGDLRAVGTTPASFAVGSSGAANYSVPINVPPGISGIQPSLALTYNSQKGNGPMGVGWAMSGLSAIIRCPATKATDGVIGSVNNDLADRFCLDGQRLILVSGTYGLSSSIYRTEIDTFSVIVADGNSGSGPGSFRVYAKNGQTLEFGKTDDSRIEAQGKSTVAVWALNRVIDRMGNFLDVTYTENNASGEVYPARIAYTGNTVFGTATYSSVTFDYETRPDAVESYQAGSVMRVATRLSHVRTFVGTTPVRDYRIAYDIGAESGKSRVKSVQECAYDSAWACLSALEMTLSLGDRISTVSSAYGAKITLTYKPLTDSSVYVADTNATALVVAFLNSTYAVSDVQTNNFITYYQYGSAKIDPDGRGFLGFGWITTRDRTGAFTKTTYSQQFPTTGIPILIEQSRFNGAGVVHNGVGGIFDFPVKKIANTLSYKKTLANANVYFPYVSSSTDTSYDDTTGGSGAIYGMESTTTTSYDDYGNPLLITVTTSDGYTKTTANTYDNWANWLIGQLTRINVTNSGPGITSLTRTSDFTYFSGTGLLKQERIEPDNIDFRVVTDYTYDIHGRRLTATVSGKDITTRTTKTDYDINGRLKGSASTLLIWANRVTNALLQTETQEFDLRSGAMTKLTGPNGLSTRWTYDAFGRKLTETRADGTATTWTYAVADSDKPATAVRMIATTATGEPNSSVYVDGLSREVRRRGQGLDGRLVFVDTKYDTNGRVFSISRPYYQGEAIYESSPRYDLLGRIIRQMAPNGGITQTSYSYNTVTVTDANSHVTTQARNGLGQLVKVTDAKSGTVTYKYDAFGNLLTTTDSVGNVVTMEFNQRGQKTKLIDKDIGAWTYTYDVLGQLLTQTDAKNQVSTMTYDVLGRMKTRTEPGMTSTWNYDTAANGQGKLASATSTTGYSRVYAYDSYGRVSTEASTIDNVAYGVTTGYDTSGRVSNVTYPTGFSITNNYNPYGYLSSVSKTGTPTTVYWTANTQNAAGQVTEELLGNYVKTKRTIDPATGWVDAIYGGITTGTEVQNSLFVFDKVGNLTNRNDYNRNTFEIFGYDELNRLNTATGGPTGNKSYAYDSIGNITSKSDVGTYAYANGRPHAVSSTTGTINASYIYDANGNMTSGNGVNIAYTAWNMPSTITKGTLTTTFGYDSEHQRTIETVGTSKKSIFINPRIDAGIHYEVETTNGVVENKHYIYARGAPVALYTSRSTGTSDTVYFHKDHLGSIVGITKSDASVAAQYYFDAWGKRVVLSGTTDYTHHGYTGHQQLDDYGLIHMNGRIYDPVLGRFQTADPNVFYPETTQGFNRYSYVDNNPLSYTDPSGYWSLKSAWMDIRGGVKVVVGAALFAAAFFIPEPTLAYNVGMLGLYTVGSGACELGWTCQIKDKAAEQGLGGSVPISAGGSGGGSSGSGGSGSVAGGGGSDGAADTEQVLRAAWERDNAEYAPYGYKHQIRYGLDISADKAYLYADGMIADSGQILSDGGEAYRPDRMRTVNQQIGRLLAGALSGTPSLDQLNAWYRYGGGQSIKVRADGLFVLAIPGSDIVLGVPFLNYGQVTLAPSGGIYADRYNFEPHAGSGMWNSVRNGETRIGGALAGQGTPFHIYFDGEPTVFKFR